MMGSVCTVGRRQVSALRVRGDKLERLFHHVRQLDRCSTDHCEHGPSFNPISKQRALPPTSSRLHVHPPFALLSLTLHPHRFITAPIFPTFHLHNDLEEAILTMLLRMGGGQWKSDDRHEHLVAGGYRPIRRTISQRQKKNPQEPCFRHDSLANRVPNMMSFMSPSFL